MEGAFQKFHEGGAAMKQVRLIWNVDGRRRTQTFRVLDEATQQDLENVVNKIKALSTRTLETALIVEFTTMNI